jgi:hypothetical protein
MSAEKRAKYTGPSGTGVDLIVPLANGESRSVHVEQGHQLPTEIDGQAVPASFRDELLKQEDNWSEVKQATGQELAAKKDDKKS